MQPHELWLYRYSQNISSSNETENLYLFNYISEISNALGNALDIDFTKKRLIRREIKKIWVPLKAALITLLMIYRYNSATIQVEIHQRLSGFSNNAIFIKQHITAINKLHF